jgi:hypothetical protein
MDAVMAQLVETGGHDAAALAAFMAEFEAQQRREAVAAADAELAASCSQSQARLRPH